LGPRVGKICSRRMALSKDALERQLTDLGIVHDTLGHAPSPTCEVHSTNLRGTPFEPFIGKGQAKNLFFKVPSGGGPLKGRLFLVCALVESVVEPKSLSTRLGIKPSAPLRFAADDIFDTVLQIPKGSVNPFVMAQASCNEVTLLLDQEFLTCERVLFHPMQSDFTTALAPDQLTAFLEQVAPGRFHYVDLSATSTITLSSTQEQPAKEEKKKEKTKMKSNTTMPGHTPCLSVPSGSSADEALYSGTSAEELKWNLISYSCNAWTSLVREGEL